MNEIVTGAAVWLLTFVGVVAIMLAMNAPALIGVGVAFAIACVLANRVR